MGTPNNFAAREIALRQACHDDKGSAPIDRTLRRAEQYYQFLIGRVTASDERQLYSPYSYDEPEEVDGPAAYNISTSPSKADLDRMRGSTVREGASGTIKGRKSAYWPEIPSE